MQQRMNRLTGVHWPRATGSPSLALSIERFAPTADGSLSLMRSRSRRDRVLASVSGSAS
jgi:hypothetical protein